MGHVGVLLHELEELCLQLLVLAEGGLARHVGPADMVDPLQGHALLGIEVGDAAEVRLGIIWLGVCGELHELEAHVDDVATVWVAVGRLDVDAQDGAADGLGDVGHAQVVAVSAHLAHDGRGLALLQRRHAGAQVLVAHAAGQRAVARVVEALDAHLVAQLTVAVGEVEDDVVAKAGVVVLGEFLAKRGERLLVLLPLRVHGAEAPAVDDLWEYERVRVLERLCHVHVVRPISNAGPCPVAFHGWES